jgi:hypothetical protein
MRFTKLITITAIIAIASSTLAWLYNRIFGIGLPQDILMGFDFFMGISSLYIMVVTTKREITSRAFVAFLLFFAGFLSATPVSIFATLLAGLCLVDICRIEKKNR